jgi:hypothetical protein
MAQNRRPRTKKVRDGRADSDNSLIQRGFGEWHSECIETEAQTLPEDPKK